MTANDFKPFIGMGEDRYLGGAAEGRGIELDVERDKARLYEIYEEVIRGRLQPLPGAVEFVHACRDRGLAIAVASGADRIKVLANLREVGLPERLFQTVVDGNQIVHKKPATVNYTDKSTGVTFEYQRRYAIETGSAATELLATNPIAMNFVQPKAAPSSERTKSGVKESGPSKGTVSRNLSIDSSQFVRTQGSRLVMGDSNRDVLLRGVVFVSNGPTPPEDKDYQGVADMHMNTVRLALEYNFFYEPNAPESYKDSGWKWLDAHVSLARKHQVYLILQMFEIEGAQFVPTKNAPFDYRTWEDAQLQARFVRLWQAIAERYRDEPQIIGYSLFCEPVVSGTVEVHRQQIDGVEAAASPCKQLLLGPPGGFGRFVRSTSTT